MPVCSSNTVLGLTKDGRVGFLQLHWPEIPGAILEQAQKLASMVQQGWRPPERPAARVEAVEAGIVHSPAAGFVMDIFPAIRVTDGNTDFEELGCIGLNPAQDALVGVLTVKLSSGYSGGLCTAGSKEFVAFWIDFGSGFTYLGTTSVNVYDLNPIPPGGVQYAVFLAVDLSAHRRPCQNGPVTAKVRAILSWQAQPPHGNPNFVPTWGNREEALIQIGPGEVVDGQVPFLSAVGASRSRSSRAGRPTSRHAASCRPRPPARRSTSAVRLRTRVCRAGRTRSTRASTPARRRPGRWMHAAIR